MVLSADMTGEPPTWKEIHNTLESLVAPQALHILQQDSGGKGSYLDILQGTTRQRHFEFWLSSLWIDDDAPCQQRMKKNSLCELLSFGVEQLQ